MKRTFFDKVIVAIVILVIVVFLALVSYTTYAIRHALISEKQNNLLGEADLLVDQTITDYLEQRISLDALTNEFDKFETAIQSNVWLFDIEGNVIAASDGSKVNKLNGNIYNVYPQFDISEHYSKVGNLGSVFDSNMITVGIPIMIDEEQKAYLMLHTESSELEQTQGDMISIMYLPFVVMILVVGIVLAYLSGTVLRPIAKINNAAREYAKGNFDAKTGVSRDDEIGELSDSLEYMASELSKLDEYRKNFIANISHDFRSPLTSIKGYLEAMLDGTIPVEKYDRYLNIVLKESQRLTKLTTGLLELNNFDTYGPILKQQMFDVVDVVRETRNTVEGQCEQKKIDFRLNCPATETTVYADKMKIGQVIYNLVDNAIKFSPRYGVIAVTIYEKNDKVFVSVKDEGPGIEKDKQNKVFERFYKTDSSRGKDKQGTGLGLSIAKEVIKAHGEQIDVVSTEGVGSEFVFSLPKKPDHENNQIIG